MSQTLSEKQNFMSLTKKEHSERGIYNDQETRERSCIQAVQRWEKPLSLGSLGAFIRITMRNGTLPLTKGGGRQKGEESPSVPPDFPAVLSSAWQALYPVSVLQPNVKS